MRVTGLKALRMCSWLLSGFGLIGIAQDAIAWWLDGGHAVRGLAASIGLIVCASALDQTRRLLAQQADELASLRAAASQRPQ